MITMTLIVIYRLVYHRTSVSFAQNGGLHHHSHNNNNNRRIGHNIDQKRCVTKITLSTTIAHVILEAPAAPLYFSAAALGTKVGFYFTKN